MNRACLLSNAEKAELFQPQITDQTTSRMVLALTPAQKLPAVCGDTAWSSPLPSLQDKHSKGPYMTELKHNLGLDPY